MKLALSRVHFPVTTLGPGRRLGIWVQGCSIRCPGCISSDTWATRTPDVDVAELLENIQPWLQECDGITISGGEPFEQPEAFKQLLRGIRQLSGVSILAYSGQSLEALENSDVVKQGLVDCLISDPFEVNMGQTKYLRGSDNQRMTCLTALGHEVFGFLDRYATDDDRRLDVMFDANGEVWLAGIPRRGDISRLQLILENQGTYLRTTEARS
ncbi:4Fe-4S single cluster domain-containing protein [Zoogloea sp.]|uniref:4Fe-4S single cluster domain-containing protein n=1 Tax=Zoogloea sp. TaxID=49181 RepID=UPI002630E4DE|nr:4Fe-4S single cluster domain-containing protein [Zoogloea sp.]MDD3352019.1 4Fe-4S single cluster domain-containing protein [Zoogloea sp.]